MPRTGPKEDILWLGVEGPTGLWEAAWAIRPSQGASDSRETAAMGILAELLEADLIEVSVEQPDRVELETLDREAARRAVLDRNNYNAPVGAPSWFVFEATTAGEERYFGTE